MIEVTNEMLALLLEYQMGAYGEMDDAHKLMLVKEIL